MLQLMIADICTGILEEGGQTDVIFADLEKGFDHLTRCHIIDYYRTCSHNNVNNDVIEWIRSALSNRTIFKVFATLIYL